MALGALLILVLGLLAWWPSIWVNQVLKTYHKPHPKLPGSAREFAEHLIKRYNLPVKVEMTQEGDHYDPMTKTLRLSQAYYDSNSLTAITIAAHEFGHALQDFNQEPSFLRRLEEVQKVQRLQKFSGIALMLAPVMGFLGHSPLYAFITLAAGFLPMLGGVLVQITTLPVELDASFNKALPILENTGLLDRKDLRGAKKILRAAAYTYLAAALKSLIDIFTWMKGFRR